MPREVRLIEKGRSKGKREKAPPQGLLPGLYGYHGYVIEEGGFILVAEWDKAIHIWRFAIISKAKKNHNFLVKEFNPLAREKRGDEVGYGM